MSYLGKVGQRFGRWLVVGKPTTKKNYYWCLCECGVRKEVFSSSLVKGTSTSCGCFRVEATAARMSTHGKSKTKEFRRFYQSVRKAKKLNATPRWSDLVKIKRFYENCPEGYEVDHIIPLQGKLVSGLHVIHNLQYLTPSENYSKGNKFIPA